ncbi:MAG TPA: DUF5317 family protein [Candidatus Dormibacteraeota bacterium]|nr:DUF5317 family protein [Candidatus Dormibacteraeota bacterium]
MLLLIPIAVGALAGLVASGRIANWLDSPLRWPWVVVVALLVREAVALTPLRHIDVLRFVYAAFLLVLIGWTVWHVKRLPGVWIIGLGALMNLAVIAANDFRMPVVAAYAGKLVEAGNSGQYTVMDSSTRLAFLGDRLATPVWLGGVYSPGDVVIGLGAGIVAFLLTAWYRARV